MSTGSYRAAFVFNDLVLAVESKKVLYGNDLWNCNCRANLLFHGHV